MARSSTSGQGRPKGSKNKRTAEKIAQIEASGLMPLDYMLQVMRDDEQPSQRRDEMAKASAPYLHPKLSNSEHKVSGEVIAEVRWRLAGS